MKHTNWIVTKRTIDNEIYDEVDAKQGRRFKLTIDTPTGITKADGVAFDSANLIASAPELLEALQLLLDHRGMMGSPAWAVAEAAVKKATGGAE